MNAPRETKTYRRPLEAPFGWFGAVIMVLGLLVVFGLLQDRDARIERKARAEDAARVKTYQQMIATCPASDSEARTVIAFFRVTGGQIVFEHCVPMRPKTAYSTATQAVISMTERQPAPVNR